MLTGFILLVILISILKIETGRRVESILAASIIWSIYSFTLVEVLSVFKQVRFIGVVGGWILFDVVLIVLVLLQIKESGREKLSKIGKALLAAFAGDVKEYILTVLLWGVGITVFLLALLTVPYNWDSMTYHLPRIMHWVQNRSVAHYAVNDTRQISSPVLAEFINLQVYIFSGGSDRFFNMLQYGSYIYCAWLVAKISELLGCSKFNQKIASLLFMSMPIAFAEAINTQVDLFSTTWLLIFMYYFLKLYSLEKLKYNRGNMRTCLALAASFGLGYLAKPSVNIGMAALLLILLAKCIKEKDKISDVIKLLAPALLTITALFVPEKIRMYRTFGSFSDPVVGSRQLVGTLKPNYLIVNLLKNLVHNFPTVYLYDSPNWMAKLVMVAAKLLHVDINDPTIAEDGVEFAYRSVPNYGQDTATNFIIVFFALIAVVYMLISYRKKTKDISFKYVVISSSLFVIFCAALRWEAYVTRYMVNYLALLCPVAACAIQSGSNVNEECGSARATGADGKSRFCFSGIVTPIVIFMCVCECISLARYHEVWCKDYSNSRPQGYFAYAGDMNGEYWQLMDILEARDCQNLGIKLSNNSFEYPIWQMMRAEGYRIENVLISNQTDRLLTDFDPDCLIIDRMYGDEDIVEVSGAKYALVSEYEGKRVAVYERQG